MKNKEIEELLNDLKNTADTSFFAVCSSEEELKKMPRGVCNFLTLNDKKAKLLLSYIEQLEKIIYKAIEYLIEIRKSPSYEIDEKIDNLEEILKGDSDE